MLVFSLGNASVPGLFQGKEGNAWRRSVLALFLIWLCCLTGEELIWEAAMMIFICDIAPAVAGV